jgi:hypothetical protein
MGPDPRGPARARARAVERSAVLRHTLAQPEKCQDREDNHDEADEVNNIVHECTLSCGFQDRIARTPRFTQNQCWLYPSFTCRSPCRADEPPRGAALGERQGHATTLIKMRAPKCSQPLGSCGTRLRLRTTRTPRSALAAGKAETFPEEALEPFRGRRIHPAWWRLIEGGCLGQRLADQVPLPHDHSSFQRDHGASQHLGGCHKGGTS